MFYVIVPRAAGQSTAVALVVPRVRTRKLTCRRGEERRTSGEAYPRPRPGTAPDSALGRPRDAHHCHNCHAPNITKTVASIPMIVTNVRFSRCHHSTVSNSVATLARNRSHPRGSEVKSGQIGQPHNISTPSLPNHRASNSRPLDAPSSRGKPSGSVAPAGTTASARPPIQFHLPPGIVARPFFSAKRIRQKEVHDDFGTRSLVETVVGCERDQLMLHVKHPICRICLDVGALAAFQNGEGIFRPGEPRD